MTSQHVESEVQLQGLECLSPLLSGMQERGEGAGP